MSTSDLDAVRYELHKATVRARQAKQAAAGRDIGAIPEVPPRGVLIKEKCRENLREFLEFFMRPIFSLEWSNDHLKALDTLQDVFLNGGQFAYAMPRGNGKTSMCIGAVVWAMLYGHRRFIVPVCATGPAAERFLESVKTIIETNSRIARVFPEVAYPIQKLDGINQRAAGQTYKGNRTRIRWTGKRLILPTIEGSQASGVIVHAAGLLGAVRGLSQASPDDLDSDDDSEEFWNSTDLEQAFEPETLEDGGIIRPDASILDDPQTDESARNPAQTEKRLTTINKAILALAGPNKRIAVVMPCTVIQPDDLADQLLDRQRNPEWRGWRTKLLASMPNESAMKMWQKYRDIREDSLREHEDIRLATEFYRDNIELMSRGAVVSWEHRYEPENIDALQYAMERWAKDEESFFAEYQNEPRAETQDGVETLHAKELLARCDGSKRGEVPEWATTVTAFADIQQDILPWMIVAWGENLRGRIIDYGAWPEQSRSYYTLRDVTPTLRQSEATDTVEAGVESGLRKLSEFMLSRGVDWFGVDANWPLSTQIVYQAAREWKHVFPCHGRFVGASSLPMDQWKRKPGSRKGHFYWIEWQERVRTISIDSNSWKTLVCKRLQEDPTRGISWFGDTPHKHRMLCDQLSAEYGVRVSGRGRKVDEWKNRPGRDNHWWDCLVGCAVGAVFQGLEIAGREQKKAPKRLSAAEIAKMRSERA